MMPNAYFTERRQRNRVLGRKQGNFYLLKLYKREKTFINRKGELPYLINDYNKQFGRL